MNAAMTSKGGSSDSSIAGIRWMPRGHVSGYDMGFCTWVNGYAIDKNLTGPISSRPIDFFKISGVPTSMRDLKTAQTSYIACSTRSTTLSKTSLQFRQLWNQSLSNPTQHLQKSSFKLSLFIFLFAIVSALLSGTAAYAQLDQGTLAGTVHDSTGASIPNATVTLVDEATGLSLVRKSDNEGIFTFTPIKIGSYKVTVSAQGFSKAEQRDLSSMLPHVLRCR